jgi:hypothetical protein
LNARRRETATTAAEIDPPLRQKVYTDVFPDCPVSSATFMPKYEVKKDKGRKMTGTTGQRGIGKGIELTGNVVSSRIYR